MSKKKKPSNKTVVQPLSPKNIIIQRGRTYPIVECWISRHWQGIGEASIAIVRKMGGDKFAIGMYLLDLYCLGLKDGFYYIEPEYTKEEILAKVHKDMDMMACDATLAQNIIYGAIEYAEDLGFKPTKEFAVLQYLLDDVEELDYIEVAFGFEGKPMYIPGPHDNVGLILNTLNKSVGEGNYIFNEDDDDDLPDELADLDEEEYEIWGKMDEEERLSYLIDYKIAALLDEDEVSYKASEEEKAAIVAEFMSNTNNRDTTAEGREIIKTVLLERVNQLLLLKKTALEEEEDVDEFDCFFTDIAIDLNFYIKRFANISPEMAAKFKDMTEEEQNELIASLMNAKEEDSEDGDFEGKYGVFEDEEGNLEDEDGDLEDKDGEEYTDFEEVEDHQ